MHNTLTLHPYQINSTWVFDDERTGLKEEAFVLGMSEIITRVVDQNNIIDATAGFDLHFSDQPFDGYNVVIEKEYHEDEGTWYAGDIYGLAMRGWLCPALFLYFKEAPENIYVAVNNLQPNVNPIWNSTGKHIRQFYAPLNNN